MGMRSMLHFITTKVRRGEARDIYDEIVYRLRGVDLRCMTLDDLGLPAERAHAYSFTSGVELRRVMDRLPITASDAIIDIGCGKGGAMITFARYPFRRIAGLDFSPIVLEAATRNMRKLHINTPIDWFCCDAGAFDGLDDYNYLYLYNPFPGNVMHEVVTRLAVSLRRVPRTLTIIYRFPTCHDVLMESGLFQVSEMKRFSIYRYVPAKVECGVV